MYLSFYPNQSFLRLAYFFSLVFFLLFSLALFVTFYCVPSLYECTIRFSRFVRYLFSNFSVPIPNLFHFFFSFCYHIFSVFFYLVPLYSSSCRFFCIDYRYLINNTNILLLEVIRINYYYLLLLIIFCVVLFNRKITGNWIVLSCK